MTFISKDICAVQLVEKTFPMCYPSLVQVQEETLDCGKKLSLLETELLTRCHYLGDEPTNSVLSEFSDPPSCGFSSLGSLSSQESQLRLQSSPDVSHNLECEARTKR